MSNSLHDLRILIRLPLRLLATDYEPESPRACMDLDRLSICLHEFDSSLASDRLAILPHRICAFGDN